MNNKTEEILNSAINIIEECLNIVATSAKEKKKERVLHIISLSEDKASASYMKNKCIMGEKYGVKTLIHKPNTRQELDLILTILSKDKNNRVIIQRPYNEKRWGNISEHMEKIPKYMDVDGFTFNNLDLINIKSFSDMISNPNFSPTAKGVITLIKYCLMTTCGYNLKGKNITVIGKGLTSGLPIATMCEQLGATVTWCNSGTNKNKLKSILEQSDFIISCAGTGKEDLVTKEMHSLVKNACYINVGMNRDENGKLKGDINYSEISELDNTLFCNPLTGSTGKLTTMCLILNTLLN